MKRSYGRPGNQLKRSAKPLVELESWTYSDGVAELRARDLLGFVKHVGEEIFVDIMACAIQADRLAAMAYSILEGYTPGSAVSVFKERQLVTFEFLAGGTLRELAIVLPRLRGRLLKAHLITKGGWPKELYAIERFVEKHRRFIDIRDQVGFHLDFERLRQGLLDVCASQQVIIRSGVDPRRDECFVIGHAAAYRAFGVTDDERNEIFYFIIENLRVGKQIDVLFRLLVTQSGVPLRHVRVGEPSSKMKEEKK